MLDDYMDMTVIFVNIYGAGYNVNNIDLLNGHFAQICTKLKSSEISWVLRWLKTVSSTFPRRRV